MARACPICESERRAEVERVIKVKSPASMQQLFPEFKVSTFVLHRDKHEFLKEQPTTVSKLLDSLAEVELVISDMEKERKEKGTLHRSYSTMLRLKADLVQQLAKTPASPYSSSSPNQISIATLDSIIQEQLESTIAKTGVCPTCHQRVAAAKQEIKLPIRVATPPSQKEAN